MNFGRTAEERYLFARTFVLRYQSAVAAHPKIGPLTLRQKTEVSNQEFWWNRMVEAVTEMVPAGSDPVHVAQRWLADAGGIS